MSSAALPFQPSNVSILAGIHGTTRPNEADLAACPSACLGSYLRPRHDRHRRCRVWAQRGEERERQWY